MIDIEEIEKQLASDRGHLAPTAMVVALIAEIRELRAPASLTQDEILAIANLHVFIPRDGTDGVTEGELLNFANALLDHDSDRGAK